MEDEKYHPIIDRPWEYAISELHYHIDRVDPSRSFIDMHLKRGDVLRRLRFMEPRDLSVEQGFPEPTGGMSIKDVRARQWEGVGVEVGDFEASWGAIKFLAREVLDLDTQQGG